MSRTVVIGAGIAGLTAAISLATQGEQTVLIAAGLGGLTLSQGSIDVWGSTVGGERVADPIAAVAKAPAGHPYALIGAKAVEQGVTDLSGWLRDWFSGDLHHNRVVPTAIGAWRPTCLVPSGYGVVPADGQKWAVVGLTRLKDFQPELIAANLSRSPLPGGGHISARPARLDIVPRAKEVDSSGLTFARALDDPDFRTHFAAAMREVLREGEIVALPAVLGLNDRLALQDIAQRVGHEVTEVVMPPASVPGLRLDQELRDYAVKAGVRIVLGAAVEGAHVEGTRVLSLSTDTSGHLTDFPADHVVLAAGGLESGAIELDSHGNLTETIFGLPVSRADGPLVNRDYWAEQALFATGVAVDAAMRPVDSAGRVVYENLYAAGGVIAGAQRWKEKSGEGIAIGSAWAAAHSILAANKDMEAAQ